LLKKPALEGEGVGGTHWLRPPGGLFFHRVGRHSPYFPGGGQIPIPTPQCHPRPSKNGGRWGDKRPGGRDNNRGGGKTAYPWGRGFGARGAANLLGSGRGNPGFLADIWALFFLGAGRPPTPHPRGAGAFFRCRGPGKPRSAVGWGGGAVAGGATFVRGEGCGGPGGGPRCGPSGREEKGSGPGKGSTKGTTFGAGKRGGGARGIIISIIFFFGAPRQTALGKGAWNFGRTGASDQNGGLLGCPGLAKRYSSV